MTAGKRLPFHSRINEGAGPVEGRRDGEGGDWRLEREERGDKAGWRGREVKGHTEGVM